MSLTFAQWKAAAQAHANALGLPSDLWVKDDPYDLLEIGQKAFRKKEDPNAFVERVFEDDLARMANDEVEFQESLAAMDEDDP